MILTLQVAGSPSKRATVGTAGGSIGRLPTSTLSLDGDNVSRTHALIHYRDGRFYIEDRSSNGISLDTVTNRLTPKQPVELKSGSVLYIDPYEIRIDISQERPSSVPGARSDLIPVEQSAGRTGLTGFLNPDELAAPIQHEVIGSDWNESGGSPWKEPRSASGPPAASPIDSSNLDTPPPRVDPRPLPVSPASPMKQPSAAPGTETANAADGMLRDLLAGAGLNPTDVTPELMENLGRILHVVVTGVMDILEAREQMKKEFRVDVTRFVRQGSVNNPLKFSRDARDALHNLLVKRQEGYLGAVDAFDDAFEDLRHHQLATLAGVRQAFAAMLKHFDPEQLEGRFDRQQRGSIVPGRLRYWDLYVEWFRDMVGDVDGSFRTLFGEEFGEAYEEHLRRLKSQGRSRDARHGDSL